MSDIKIPKGQIRWESIYDANHILKQIVTSDEMRRKYYLYNVDNGILTKIESNTSPVFKGRIL